MELCVPYLKELCIVPHTVTQKRVRMSTVLPQRALFGIDAVIHLCYQLFLIITSV